MLNLTTRKLSFNVTRVLAINLSNDDQMVHIMDSPMPEP